MKVYRNDKGQTNASRVEPNIRLCWGSASRGWRSFTQGHLHFQAFRRFHPPRVSHIQAPQTKLLMQTMRNNNPSNKAHEIILNRILVLAPISVYSFRAFFNSAGARPRRATTCVNAPTKRIGQVASIASPLGPWTEGHEGCRRII